MMKYFLLPLGCATNRADAERIAGVLETIGYTEASSEEEASLIGVVACSIRQSAIDRIYGKVRDWNKRKSRESLITFVSGCILPADEQKFLKTFDLVVKLNDIPQLPRLLNEYGMAPPANFWAIAPRRSSTFSALVPIQNGCDKFCTYCAVPYTRGREVSRPSKDILSEIEQLISKGYKRITLLGQNVNSYGIDQNGKELSFAELLDAVGNRTDRASERVWVHYTSPHPRDMTKEVLTIQASHPSLAHYLNLPLQAGNNDVLRRMNRRYTVEWYMDILATARQIIPDLVVSTDIIVGFCGETEDQFQDTVRAMEQAEYDMAFIAQYSKRPGVMAARRFADDVPQKEKKRRHTILTKILKRSAEKKNQRLLGQVIPVIIEAASRKAGKILGRTEGLKSVECSGDASLIGEWVKIKITQVDSWRLYGEMTQDSRSMYAFQPARRYSAATAAGSSA